MRFSDHRHSTFPHPKPHTHSIVLLHRPLTAFTFSTFSPSIMPRHTCISESFSVTAISEHKKGDSFGSPTSRHTAFPQTVPLRHLSTISSLRPSYPWRFSASSILGPGDLRWLSISSNPASKNMTMVPFILEAYFTGSYPTIWPTARLASSTLHGTEGSLMAWRQVNSQTQPLQPQTPVRCRISTHTPNYTVLNNQ